MPQFKALEKLKEETDAAHTAFVAYVEMGSKRSFRKLLDAWAEEEKRPQSAVKKRKKTFPTRRIETLQDWSVKYRWQERISTYTAEVVEQRKEIMLEGAALLDEHFFAMARDLTKQRVSRRAMIEDPRDADKPPGERRMVEQITLRVNSREYADLCRAWGQLNKDVNAVYGVPEKVDITSKGEKIGWAEFIEVDRSAAEKSDEETDES